MIILPKTGNFITGVCHPYKNVELIKQAHIGWTRIDIPFPFAPGEWGKITPEYAAFRERVKFYSAGGLKTMCVTPYPRSFARYGVDPASPEGLEQVEKICKFMAEDLAPCGVAGYQITNELNVFHFRIPLTIEQAPDFIIAGIKGVVAGDGNAICGYNSAGVAEEAQGIISRIKPYHHLLDYMGVDTYRGTWGDGEPDDIIGDISVTYDAVGLPVLIQEFGFSSLGEIFTRQEVDAYVKDKGFNSVEDVYKDAKGFVMRLPYYVAKRVMESPEEDWAKNALGMMPHLLRKWPGGSKKYRHTAEGQAAFYDEVLGKILAHPHICGAMIYSWSDPRLCFNCYHPDCPCETAWGITTPEEEPKPAYYVIKNHFSKI